jgi:hyperosmotically inducible protein
VGSLLAIIVTISSDCPAQVRPSDSLLTMSVEQQFRNDVRLREAELKVSTIAGVVTLQGEVASYLDKLRAERACKQVDGVREVQSMIRVRPVSASDDQICRDIEARWKQDRVLASSQIKATVCRHVVTIQGTAQDQVQKRRAEQLAREVRGVKLVKNDVEVRGTDLNELKSIAPKTDQALEADALASLRRDNDLAGLPIAVSVRDRMVVLSGSVVNLYQKQRAANMVRLTPGVLQIDNQLAIAWPDADTDVEPARLPMEQLVGQIYVQLKVATNLDASRIRVTYADDLLILQGNVGSMSEKLAAANAARRVTGVMRIANELTVTDDLRDDLAIRDDVQAMLTSDAVLADEQIEVAAERGAIALRGRVASFGNKRRAVQLAARVRGVQSIKNNILVAWSPEVSDDGLAKRIEARLTNNPQTRLAIKNISIQVTDGDVTLTGTVADESMLSTISDLATNTDCVRHVHIHLRVKAPHRKP